MSNHSDIEEPASGPYKVSSNDLLQTGQEVVVEPLFKIDMHISYFDRCLFYLPAPYSSADSTRMSLGYFGLAGLDLLDKVDTVVTPETKKGYIDWIYAQQVLPLEGDTSPEKFQFCGFRGSPFPGGSFNFHPEEKSKSIPYDRANLAMTYTALLLLLIFKDDFSRVNREAILGSLKSLQQEDGSFVPVYGSSESDQRFTFCAFAISYMLNGWSYFDVEKSVDYIQNSQTYDFGISQGPNQESHGGSTYCALAALTLCGRLDSLKNKEGTLKWCLNRQGSGFHGRLNKPDDTCYSFWIGASIKMLGGFHLINQGSNRRFLYSTQTKIGGFGKYPGSNPDVLHSYMGLCGLALMGEDGVKPLYSPLNVTEDTHAFWKEKSNILQQFFITGS